MIKKSGNPETLFTVTQKYFMALKWFNLSIVKGFWRVFNNFFPNFNSNYVGTTYPFATGKSGNVWSLSTTFQPSKKLLKSIFWHF